ncbi:polyketide synthase [Myxococcus stipitatus DSM 14675]|uniref:Polyketide synthase n=1 Tax=Myxococcus stipitatus (strain DSM 14675 / JCM 12634 / Mx s8) TaxID=1278073 RepID=L7UDD5_MYXSD|nr:type I polyketide synthase [Myxococcus stipitatus]AGC45622.1 polyketide synthase [Myxococcus stipitatus DSM 14675]
MTTFAEKIAQYSPKRLALLALELKSKLDAIEGARSEPVALIGMACRFPGGASDPESFWHVLRDGVDAVTEVPSSRWTQEEAARCGPEAREKPGARWGAFLDEVDRFDAEFFGISPREAHRMDPQQRLLLEVAWEALEDAGQDVSKLTGSRTGVFAGVYNDDYAKLELGTPSDQDASSVTGTINSVVAGRLSYLLDLQGPCMVVDTACSSSLVALHLASQSLRAGECSMALAGGVNLILSPHSSLRVARGDALAPDGRCKTFDARANGFVRGEGCGVLVLKRLSDALAAGDPILALLRGSAVNQDGKSAGLTAPNMVAQTELLRQALKSAGLEPADVDCIEAHGTGTSLGDPIEMEAIKAVYGQGRSEQRPLVVSAAKTNIGHLEAAAGIAGVIKAVLSMRHQTIPPLLHLQRMNPRIDLEGLPILLPTFARAWPATERARRIAVSSFGASGTNAHVILEEPPAPPVRSAPPEPGARLLALSARTSGALQEWAGRFADFLATSPEAPLQDVCHTAALRRTHHEHRLTVVGGTAKELAEKLREAATAPMPARKGAGPRKVVFVFPGQGSQWLGMGRRLLEEEPVFRAALERIEAALRRHVSWGLVEVLCASAEQSRLGEIDVVQPVLFAMEVALAELWRSWGITPDAVLGHSMGEVAAAHVAGALSLEDAASIICERSKLLRRISGQGAMLAVELPLSDARGVIAGREARVAIAVSNSPTSTVLAGDAAVLEEVRASLAERNVFCRWVKVDVASHSPQVDGLREELLAVLSPLRPRPATTLMLSTVTASACEGTGLDAAYWVRNLREPVLFSASVARLIEDGHAVFIELSPHPILLPAIERCLQHAKREGLLLASLRREEAERAVMLESLGALYRAEHPVDWARLFPAGGRVVPLPPYPWQRKRYWLDDAVLPVAAAPERLTSLKGRPVSVAQGLEGQVFELELGSTSLPWLGAHRLGGVAVLPASALVELVLSAVAEVSGSGPRTLTDVEFERALVLPESKRRLVQVHLAPASEGPRRFHVHSRPVGASTRESSWVLHARGEVRLTEDPRGATRVSIESVRAACVQHVRSSALYDALAQRNVQYESPLRTLGEVFRRSGEALGRITSGTELVQEGANYQLHPALLDAALQTLASAVMEEGDGGALFMPVRIDEIACAAERSRIEWAHASAQTPDGAAAPVGALELLDASGAQVASMRGVRLRRVPSASILEALGAESEEPLQDWLYDVTWEARPALTSTPSAADWLVFVDPRGCGSALVEEIARHGEACVTVTAGRAYQRLDERRFVVDPEQPEDFARLLREAPASATRSLRVLYLWGLQAVGDAVVSPWTSTGALHLIQGVLRERKKARVWLVTRGAQVTGAAGEDVVLAQSPLWGFGRVVSLEQPDLWGGLIDLDPNDTSGEAAALLREVAASEADGEDQLALRKDRRLVPRLVPTRAQKPAEAPRLRSDATYLVTGGLGGLGLKVARWLVEQGARHLVLVGRRALTAGGEESKRREEVLEELRSLGATVVPLAADISDRARMEEVLREAASTHPLRGIFHAASLMSTQRLEVMDASSMTAMLRPKALGALVLHELTRGLDLDFFVMFSSTSTLWGASGLAHYGAANQVLEALAHLRHAAGLPATTLHWGTWDEVSGERSRDFERFGLKPMAAPRALEAMGQAMRSGTRVQTVASVDWSALKPLWEARRRRPFLQRVGVATSVSGTSVRAQLVTELESLPPPRRFDALLRQLQREVGRILGFPLTEPPPIDRGFFQMGMTSLMTVELRNVLQRGFGKELPASLAFDYPTVEALAKRLAGLAEALEIPLPGDAAPPPRAQAEVMDERGLSERLSRMDEMSDDEIERLIAEKIAGSSH